MQDIVLIGTILIFLTIIYTLPIAALYNVPNNQRNRILCILVPSNNYTNFSVDVITTGIFYYGT